MVDNPAMNPDFQELLNLLALLPPTGPGPQSPVDVPKFWLDYAAAHPLKYGRWIADTLGASLDGARSTGATWNTVRQLSAYCLSFFDQLDNKECMTLLDDVGQNAINTGRDGDIGRRWAASVCQIAWRLFVTAETRRITPNPPA